MKNQLVGRQKRVTQTKDKKQELIALAKGLIAERGLDSFSYADLSKLSGLAKPSIHFHFPTKADLILAVIDQVMENLHAKVEFCITHFGDEALVYFLRGMAQLDWGCQICPLFSMQAQFNVLPPELQKQLAEVANEELQIMSDLVRRYGNLPHLQLAFAPQDAAKLILSCSKGALLYGRTEGSDWLSPAVEQLLALVVVKNK